MVHLKEVEVAEEFEEESLFYLQLDEPKTCDHLYHFTLLKVNLNYYFMSVLAFAGVVLRIKIDGAQNLPHNLLKLFPFIKKSI